MMNDKEVTETMIVSFDLSTFQAACSGLSEKYKESLSDFDAVASEIFKSGEKWCNQDVVHSVVVALFKLQGQEPTINRIRINGNHGGYVNMRGSKKKPRNLEGGNLSGGCK